MAEDKITDKDKIEEEPSTNDLYICKVFCTHPGTITSVSWHQKFLIVPRQGDVIEKAYKNEDGKKVLVRYKVDFISHVMGKEDKPLVRIHCSQP